jgi:branched-chain amino acid aminotransferase
MAAYINNQFVTNEETLLHVKDLSIQRGYAVFDFFRTMKGIPLFIDDHLNRFYNSAAAMHLKIDKSREEIKSIAQQLIQQTALPEAGIRLMLTGGYSADGYQLAEPNFIITCNPVKTTTQEDFEKGFSIITQEHQRELPHIKSINYLMAVWLQPLLKEKQANDVLYYTKESITEFPRCNVFIVTADNKLVTPARNMLLGITRKNVLALAQGILPVIERDIPVDELTTAQEIFLTSTTKKIIPIVKVNGQQVGDGKPGEVTSKLYQMFLKLEQSLLHQ